MAEIIPAVLEQSFPLIKDKIAKLKGLVEWIHLDVADGLFVPSQSWQNSKDLQTLSGKIKIEIHLMTEEPEHHLGEWLAAADRILIHYESSKNLNKIFDALAESAVAAGLALLIETPLEAVKPYLNKLKVIQLLGIAKIGYQGQLFDERVIARVRSLRSLYPDVKISVDGGVNLANAKELILAGADRLVVGAAIWRSDNPLATLREFQTLAAPS